MPGSVLALVFTDTYQRGTGQLLAVGTSSRYDRVSSDTMLDWGFDSRGPMSVTVYSSSTADAHLILFGPRRNTSAPAYTDRFIQITNRKNSDSELDVGSFMPIRSDMGVVSSMLLVAANRRAEVRQSFKDLFFQKCRDIIEDSLTHGAEFFTDPILTWEPWPSGIPYLDPNTCYLKVHQELSISLHCWPHYSASITYYIHLYLDRSDLLRGYVAYGDYWIEGGVKHDDIEDNLVPEMRSCATTLNSELVTQLNNAFGGAQYSDIYFLPGDQVSPPQTGVTTGRTIADVTIVLEKK
jgi:hypothetical protein